DGDVVGLNPHYAGRTHMRVGLTVRVPRPESSILDGAFHGWADPMEAEPESGQYPFVFDVPDYGLTGAVVVPSICEVQLTAFAHELQAYESEAAYAATQSGAVKFATESFIPAGLFNAATNEQNTPPQAYAIFTGRVLVILRFTRSVIMTYLQDMGFHDGNGRDRLRTLMLMQEQGEEIVASGARYLKLAVDDRLELWTRIIEGKPEGYLHSYFVG